MKVKSALFPFSPCLPSALSLIILYLDRGSSLPAGHLASRLASLQNNLHTFVKGSELSKIQIAYGFTQLKDIFWLSRQMNLMNSLPTSPASSLIFPSLMLILPYFTHTFDF